MKKKDEKKQFKKLVPKIHFKKITLRQLKQYKNFLQAIMNVRKGKDLAHIMYKLRDADFRMICTCMHDFLHDSGYANKYFTHEEADRLKKTISPWSKTLRKFTSPKIHLKEKRKMLFKKQRGGQAGEILGSVIGALLPIAWNAIETHFKKATKK